MYHSNEQILKRGKPNLNTKFVKRVLNILNHQNLIRRESFEINKQ